MKKYLTKKTFYCLAPLAVGALAAFLTAGTSFGFEVDVELSPKTVNIESLGDAHPVRVFTSMPYLDDLEATAFINGEFIPSYKSKDISGYLIMKFYVSEIKSLPGLLLGDYNLVRIEGFAAGPEFPMIFWGEDWMYLVDYRQVD